MPFGDGSDGDVVISVNTTLTRDMHYNNLTIDDGVTLYPDGYVIYARNQLLINGTINRNGNDGGNDQNYYQNYYPGSALPTRSVGGSGRGGMGGNILIGGWYECRSGYAAPAVLNSVAGSDGGRGGTGDGSPGCVGGAKGYTQYTHTIDASNVTDLITHASSRLGGAGGGGGGSVWHLRPPHISFHENGYGGGSGGGVIYISGKHIIINSTGLVSANGGNGPGGRSDSDSPAMPGPGGGGGGGFIAFEYDTIVNDGDVTVNGGTTGFSRSTPGEIGEVGTIVYLIASHIRVGDNVLLIPNYGDIYDRACIKGENISVGDDVKLYPLKNNAHVAIKEKWSLDDKITIRGSYT